MNYLMILNDPPYGTERSYNGLRLALNLLSKTEGTKLTVFLMGDAASAGKAGQQTPKRENMRGWLRRETGNDVPQRAGCVESSHSAPALYRDRVPFVQRSPLRISRPMTIGWLTMGRNGEACQEKPSMECKKAQIGRENVDGLLLSRTAVWSRQIGSRVGLV